MPASSLRSPLCSLGFNTRTRSVRHRSVGPLTEYRVHDRPWETEVIFRKTKLGVGLQAGIDVLVGRHLVDGVHGGITARHGHGPHRSFGTNLGWAFGEAG